MALTYNLTGVKDYKNICYQDNGNLKDITNVIIYMHMFTGWAEITKKNYKNFYIRAEFLQLLYGDLAIAQESKVEIARARITIQDVYEHIGITVNVKPITRSRFMGNLWRNSAAKETTEKFVPLEVQNEQTQQLPKTNTKETQVDSANEKSEQE